MKKYIYLILLTSLIFSCSDSINEEENLDDFTKDSGTFADNRDGHKYKWVRIGEQIWMGENLAYLPSVSPSSAESYADPYYFVYGYQSTSVSAAKATYNYSTYGVLYNWIAAKTACPTGWHLPTDDEWKQLEMALGMSQNKADDTDWRGTNEGTKLKATSGWYNNGNGTDDYGFSALPGGYRAGSGEFGNIIFGDISTFGAWWSYTEYSSFSAWHRILNNSSKNIVRSTDNKEYGFSVRCVRN